MMHTTANECLIEIDLNRLGRHFTENDLQPWTESNIERWLIDQGFVPRPDGWLCDEQKLALLEQSEYRIEHHVV